LDEAELAAFRVKISIFGPLKRDTERSHSAILLKQGNRKQNRKNRIFEVFEKFYYIIHMIHMGH
jgi:hypothetical protein